MTDPTPVALIDPNRGFREWNITEVFGHGPNGQYVPNIDDKVWDWAEGLFRVLTVDYTTGVSQIVKWVEPRDPNVIDDHDILLGTGPGPASASYRIYLDRSVFPHTLSFDARLHAYSSAAAYVKVFLGANIGDDGEVVSRFFDSGGSLLGENIPLEVVGVDSVRNVAIKAPVTGYTNQEMDDGELVTAVIYSRTDQLISRAALLIENTGFVRTTDAARKYIRAIGLESPFLDPSNPSNLQYPINMPVAALNLVGVVHYSDGTTRKLPVDGTKFSMLGITSYIATVQGQKIQLVLSYKLSEDEMSYQNTPTPDRHITKAFTATTSQSQGAYTVRLFGYPVWVPAIDGYRMEYWLYNLDRAQYWKVSNNVLPAQSTGVFDPTSYGVVQHLNLAIDLSKIMPMQSAYRHVQALDVTLLAPGTDTAVDNWVVGQVPGQQPPYGVGLKARVEQVNQNLYKHDLSSGINTLGEWLEKVYYATLPLLDTTSESRPPRPDFFKLVSGASTAEYAIDQWNQVLQLEHAAQDGTPAYLHFIKRQPGNDLQLAVAALNTHRVPSL